MKPLLRPLSGALALLLLLTLPALGGCSAARSSAEEKATVLTIGGFDVPYALYRYTVLTLKAEADGGDPDYWNRLEDPEAAAKELQSAAFDELRQYYAVLSLAADHQLSPEDAAIRKQANDAEASAKQSYGGEAAFLEALQSAYMTLDVYRFLQTSNYCRDELFYALLNGGQITVDDTALQTFLRTDGLIRIKQVLIDPSRYDSNEAALAAAEEVRTRAVAGDDFDLLVRDYGGDLYMFNNRDGYYMMRGVRYAAFEEAAFALSVGEVSPVVKTPAGYSVLLRLEKEESYLTAHFDALKDDYRDAQFSRLLEQRASELTVTETDRLSRYSVLSIRMP